MVEIWRTWCIRTHFKIIGNMAAKPEMHWIDRCTLAKVIKIYRKKLNSKFIALHFLFSTCRISLIALWSPVTCMIYILNIPRLAYFFVHRKYKCRVRFDVIWQHSIYLSVCKRVSGLYTKNWPSYWFAFVSPDSF